MAMLHYFACLSPRPDFYAATVNHGIRKEAASDCKLVAEYCDKLGVECKTFVIDVPSFCAENKLSTETGARILRYRVFDGLQCDYVCLAHHASDNVETVLMHILRGSGAIGACGIRYDNGKYIRPLLHWTRTQIDEYVKANDVPYAYDVTNDDERYTRNFIRRKVVPVLTELNPTAEQNILRFADNIAQDEEFLDSLADITSVEFEGDSAQIPIVTLRCPKPIAYRIIRKTFAKLGVYCDIEKTHVDALLNLADSCGGKSVNLPFGYVATNDYDKITIERGDPDVEYFETSFVVGEVATPFGTLSISTAPQPNSLRFDLNKIPQRAVIRTKKQGDTFCKFGGGTKTLKKYLIDRKIPQRQRERLLLIADGNEALVICGVEISQKVKTDDNSQVCYISLRKE